MQKIVGGVGPQPMWDQLGDEYDFPLFIGKPRLFIVATTPRSGSHFLCHNFRRTGVFGCPLEYFAEGRFKDWAKKSSSNLPHETLSFIMSKRTSMNGLFGVKCHWPQFINFNHDLISDYLNLSTPFIRISRNDIVSQAVSWNIAEQTKSWISFQIPTREPRYCFEGILNAYQSIQNEKKSWSSYFLANRNPVLELIYEEFVGDIGAAFKSVSEFLDVSLPRDFDHKFHLTPKCQRTELNKYFCDRFRNDLKKLG